MSRNSLHSVLFQPFHNVEPFRADRPLQDAEGHVRPRVFVGWPVPFSLLLNHSDLRPVPISSFPALVYPSWPILAIFPPQSAESFSIDFPKGVDLSLFRETTAVCPARSLRHLPSLRRPWSESPSGQDFLAVRSEASEGEQGYFFL